MTPFVADDFVVPTVSSGPGFRLEPLGPQHNESDHVAWMSSIDYIRGTPGWENEKWPHPMTLEQNMDDLVRHARDFAERKGFTYTVLDGEEVIGCVYIYPGGDASGAEVQSWVRSDRSELDPVLWRHVEDWLEAEWPFERVSYAARRS